MSEQCCIDHPSPNLSSGVVAGAGLCPGRVAGVDFSVGVCPTGGPGAGDPGARSSTASVRGSGWADWRCVAAIATSALARGVMRRGLRSLTRARRVSVSRRTEPKSGRSQGPYRIPLVQTGHKAHYHTMESTFEKTGLANI